MRKPDWAYEGSLDAARRAAVVDALAACDQSVSRAAERLRIGRSTLYRLMEKFAIEAVPSGELGSASGADAAPDADARPGKVVRTDDGWFIVS